MKRILVVAAVAVLAVSLAACCGRKQTEQTNATGNAAVVNGVNITMAELNEKAKDNLQKMDTEIYQIKRRVLDDLIDDKLVESAAKAAGKSTEAYLKDEVDSKVTPPSDEEVKAMYEARKEQYKQPFESLKDQISGFLMQNRRMQAEKVLMAKLRSEAQVKVELEPPRVTIDISGVPISGDKDAKVTIVEFSDYQCPFCKRVRPTIWKLLDEYKGKVNYVFMDFPLSFHQYAKKAHEAARCAGEQDKYYEYNAKLFDNQQALDIKDLKKYAKDLSLDTKDFDKCLDSGKEAKFVDELMTRGVSVGVSGTPAYFINGIMLSGARPYDSFTEIINAELGR